MDLSKARYLANRATDRVSVKDFGAVGDGVTNDAEAFQNAISSGARHIYIPDGTYKIPTQIRTYDDGIEIFGSRSANLLVGASQSAGQASIAVYNSRFKASGFKITSESRTIGIYFQPTASDLIDAEVNGVEFDQCFYAARFDGSVTYAIKNARVINCKSTGVVSQNCGHFFADFCDGVTYIGNSVKYGYNTSAYGVADSKNVVISGNREELVQDSAGAVEAACQIEDSDLANAVISGNSFQHDIWVAGSNGVQVTGNKCRRMRLSVGNADGFDVHNVTFAANKAASIHAAKFSEGTPAERMSARFLNNDLSPSGVSVNGAAIAQLVYAEGTYVTELELRGNRALSDAATYALNFTRASGAIYRLFDNDFGTLAHNITDSGGELYERGNRNKATKIGSGYVDAYMSSTPTATIGSWTAVPLNAENADINGEHSSGVFTPLESGTYRFSGIMTVDPDAVGSQMGFRLYRTSGTPTELARLAFVRAADGASHGISLRSTDVYLTAGDTVALEYYFTGATTNFITGTTVTNFQITRVD